MAKLFWKSTRDGWRDSDPDAPSGTQQLEVNEQHPLPLQMMWRDDGTDEWQPVDEAHPLPMVIARVQSAVPVAAGGYTAQVSVTPTIGAVLYAAGQAVGGLLTFSNILRVAGGSGRLDAVVLTDNDNQAATLDLVLFSQTFTPTADQSAFAPSNADLLHCLGHVSLSGGDYSKFSANAVCTERAIGLPVFNTVGGRDLYGQLVNRGTPTYAAVSSLTVTVKVLQD